MYTSFFGDYFDYLSPVFWTYFIPSFFFFTVLCAFSVVFILFSIYYLFIFGLFWDFKEK